MGLRFLLVPGRTVEQSKKQNRVQAEKQDWHVSSVSSDAVMSTVHPNHLENPKVLALMLLTASPY